MGAILEPCPLLWQYGPTSYWLNVRCVPVLKIPQVAHYSLWFSDLMAGYPQEITATSKSWPNIMTMAFTYSGDSDLNEFENSTHESNLF